MSKARLIVYIITGIVLLTALLSLMVMAHTGAITPSRARLNAEISKAGKHAFLALRF